MHKTKHIMKKIIEERMLQSQKTLMFNKKVCCDIKVEGLMPTKLLSSTAHIKNKQLMSALKELNIHNGPTQKKKTT